jgi:hypothetical protein
MKHTTIFDAGKGHTSFPHLRTFIDCTLAKRDNQWRMFAGGLEDSQPDIQLFSASLPSGAPLSAQGWMITPDPTEASKPALLAEKSRSFWWDGNGGRHCPSYVKGWDPEQGIWVERIYYAGAAQSFLGPYTIGYLEWDGARWVDQSAPVFTANEYWEHGSVYEPNLIYHDGKWKMWYVAGANQDDYLVQGYAESPNGRTDWSAHQIVFAPEEKVFDFCVIEAHGGYEAVFSRVEVSGGMAGIVPRKDGPSQTGLWWCKATTPSPNMADWSEPVRIAGPGLWKPVLCYDEADPQMLFVFYDNAYPNTSGFGIPMHFTLECIQVERPA